MRTVYDLRLYEDAARKVLPDGLGRRLNVAPGLPSLTRRIDIDATDPWFERIVALDRRHRMVSSWGVHRRYTEAELDGAAALQLLVQATFEPTGEECGTEFDDADACDRCGFGRRQVGPLRLDLGRARADWDVHLRPSPRGKDIARTIGGEVVVSRRLAGLLDELGATGLTLGPVLQHRTTIVRDDWRQLLVEGQLVRVARPSVAGISPSDPDERGEYRCPRGHVLGLNLLSELSIEAASWDGADFALTREAFGDRRGLLVPEPRIVISNRVGRLLRDHRVKGARIEVVHLR